MESTVLLADDSITVQKIVKLSLAEEGIEVVTVGNGEQAVQKLHEVRPSVVLADVFMPGKDGYEVCEYIKAQPATRDLPVILLVHAYEPFDAERAKQVGADSHLTKPFQSIRALVEAVQSKLSGQPATAPASGGAPDALAAAAEDLCESGAVTPIDSVDPAGLSGPGRPLGAADSADPEGLIETTALAGRPRGDDQFAMPHGADPLAELNLDLSAESVSAECGPEPHDAALTALAPEESPTAAPPENIPPTQPEEDLMLPLIEEAAGPVMPPHRAPQPQAAPPAPELGDEVLDLGDLLPPSPLGALPEADLFADADSMPVLLNLALPASPPPQPALEPQPATAPHDLLPSPLAGFDLALGQRIEAAEVAVAAAPPATLALPDLCGDVEADLPPQAARTAATRDVATPQDMLPGSAAEATGGFPAAVPDAVIDQIVSRVVERLSTRAIEEVAWEVVPGLAEVIIRRQLAQAK